MFIEDTTRLAEQATLGGLLLEPSALDEVQRWLRAGDFNEHWHGQVFLTLLERRAAGQPIDPHTMGTALVDRLGARRANLPRVADLVRVTPQRPDPAGYARMVLDGGLRREIAGTGVLLRAAAVQTACDRMPTPVTATCNIVDAAMDCAAARWSKATGQPHDEVVVPLALRAALRNTDARLGADRYLSTHPTRDPATERRHLITLIGALIAHPDHISAVADWLPSTRIPDLGWRAVYGTLVELAELGQHLDLVRVAWALRGHAHHQPALPGLHELHTAVETGWRAQLAPAIQAVAGDQVRQLADAGAAQLVAGAANPGVVIADLVDTGHLVTAALRRTATAIPIPLDRTPRSATVVGIRQGEAVSR